MNGVVLNKEPIIGAVILLAVLEVTAVVRGAETAETVVGVTAFGG
jgi:hypothetical protein